MQKDKKTTQHHLTKEFALIPTGFSIDSLSTAITNLAPRAKTRFNKN